jgi:hydroxymethylbilane synthase
LKSHFIIGSRGSELALWQSRNVQAQLNLWGYSSEIKIIQTQGDIASNLSFDKIEGKGFFTKEIEKALLEHEIDIAVHSHKDLQTTSPEGLMIGAISSRANPEDVLLIHQDKFIQDAYLNLASDPIIGTSSSRRKAQLIDLMPGARLRDIRGNVPRRLEKLRAGEFDAIVIARAGIDRLELSLDGLKEVRLKSDVFVPAPAQGVLAIQCRNDDEETVKALAQIHCKEVEDSIWIEREILRRMDGGCHLPLGVFVVQSQESFSAHIAYATHVGSVLQRTRLEHSIPTRLVELSIAFLKGNS